MRAGLLLLFAVPGLAQQPVSPSVAPYVPNADELTQVRKGLSELNQKLAALRAEPALKADVEIYAKAADWILRHPEEFYKKEYLGHTLSVLQSGASRAAELADGRASWPQRKGRVIRAYRSAVDGSVQPYALLIPASYDPARPTRLDVVLHGRAATMNEVSFIAAQEPGKPFPPELNHLQLEVFGRTNNAYRWAGESDVFEALASVQARYAVDPKQIVLRGFSMGGAGTWHIGLHHPDRWAAMEAGAGFVETVRYAKMPNLPDYQKAAVHIYDSADYALNAYNLPVVGYGGEIDPQLAASVTIREAIDRENLPPADLRTLFLVGPKTAHKWHPDSKKQSDAFMDASIRNAQTSHDTLHFTTYTTRYNRCHWIRIEGLDEHYRRAEVHASRNGAFTRIETENVARIAIDGPPSIIVIDGQHVEASPSHGKVDGQWMPASKVARASGLRFGDPAELLKRHGLQGPIDDAFQAPFICVNPPEAVAKDWAKWMRGDLPVAGKPVSGKHVVLFGDADSNPLIARINAKLPIRWANGEIAFGAERYPASEYSLKMIYPNPDDPTHYLVLNTVHTFGEKEFRGTNALLFPRLGDYAIVRKADGSVVRAGYFDERWQLPATKPGTHSPAP